MKLPTPYKEQNPHGEETDGNQRDSKEKTTGK